jgi:hypothetical protein
MKLEFWTTSAECAATIAYRSDYRIQGKFVPLFELIGALTLTLQDTRNICQRNHFYLL